MYEKGYCTDSLLVYDFEKGASINYVDRILRIFDPPPPPFVDKLCSIVDIWKTPPFPLLINVVCFIQHLDSVHVYAISVKFEPFEYLDRRF